MRECLDCRSCCEGLLTGNARGSWFGNLKKCKYLTDIECSIYDKRPSTCQDYYCAWAQELLPEWMKPSLIGIVVSVQEDKNGKQFLNAISQNDIPDDVIKEINNFTIKNKTYFKVTKVIPIRNNNASIL